jgi:16S rRNA (guanine(1405)-N(7))-methyltransferase
MPNDNIVSKILESKKYSSLDRAVVERIYAETAQKYKKNAEAVKAVKKVLHIINGSFLTANCHARAGTLINNYTGQCMYRDKDFAAQLMELHASTAERLGCAGEIYEMIGGYIDAYDTLIDIGCGYNPFALPFLPIIPKSYIAYDICSQTAGLINRYFEPLGDAYRAYLFDAATRTPDNTYDVVFMFKLMPLLEQQKKGRAFELLNAMKFRHAVISFPTKSASGREKGMERFYTEFFTCGLPEKITIVNKAVYENELFLVIKPDER